MRGQILLQTFLVSAALNRYKSTGTLMIQLRSLLLTSILLLVPTASFAADSYRWLHVTIETPWVIFLVLLPMVLIPAILMAILYWKFAGQPAAEKDKKEAVKQSAEVLENKEEKLEP